MPTVSILNLISLFDNGVSAQMPLGKPVSYLRGLQTRLICDILIPSPTPEIFNPKLNREPRQNDNSLRCQKSRS